MPVSKKRKKKSKSYKDMKHFAMFGTVGPGPREISRFEDPITGEVLYAEIIKVQIPLPPGTEGPLLLYDRGHEHVVHADPTPEIMQAMGGSIKKYFLAAWKDDRGWVIADNEVDQNQDW